MFSGKWEIFANFGRTAERLMYKSASSTLVKVRIFAEEMTKVVCQYEGLKSSKTANQVDRLQMLYKAGVFEADIDALFHTIRKRGNKAAHEGAGTVEEAKAAIYNAHRIGVWFLECYGDDLDFMAPDFFVPSDVDALKDSKIAELENLLTKQEKDFEQRIAQQEFALKPSEEIIEKRRAKSHNFGVKYPPTEAKTRELIDEQLRNAGWEADTVNLSWRKGTRPVKSRKIAIAEYRCKNGYADYVLFDGLTPVGVIEAKKYGKDVAGDMAQAKEYAKNIEVCEGVVIPEVYGEYKVPFIYSTNGRPYHKQLEDKSGIWFWDARNSKEHSYALKGWHWPSDLISKLEVNVGLANDALKEKDYSDFKLRSYQVNAIKAVENALVDNRREMMLAMATGTGKTRTAIAMMYRLIEAKRVRKILFLVDRTSLGEQTVDALKDIKIDNIPFDEIYSINDLNDKTIELSSKIHIATVQGMVHRLFNAREDEQIPSVGTYDFVIVDEAHRGYTEDREMTEEELQFSDEKLYMSQYRRVIDYFDAPVLALTATPALHTSRIFGEPIYTYSYADAVVDGHLVDHEPPIRFETALMQSGIHFEKDEEVEFWDHETKTIEKHHLPDELQFEIEGFNRRVVNESFNKVIAQALVEHIDPNADEKTLIFAVTDNHADMIVRLLKKAYAEAELEVDNEAIMKITGSINDSNEAIRRFKNEKYPNIAVTVDLLTTGIDVPKITNLVFLRRVRSRILYDQMLGRATRLCKEIGKDAFKIFDAVKLYDTLKKVTDMRPQVASPSQSIEDVVLLTINAHNDDEAYNFHKAELLTRLQRKKQRLDDKDISELQAMNRTPSLDSWLHGLKLMSRDELKSEMENINRMADYGLYRHKTYISNHRDELRETTRGYGDGNEKPVDYLESFTTFIRDNINKYEALNIITTRPKDLTLKELREIRIILKQNRFDAQSLQQAWKYANNEHVMAEIISFIRQAALGSPLEDQETRVKKAMKKVYSMADWTGMQSKWLERIEKQLLKNEILAPTAREYFEESEAFKQDGGYKKFANIFKDKADGIIETINENLYA